MKEVKKDNRGEPRSLGVLLAALLLPGVALAADANTDADKAHELAPLVVGGSAQQQDVQMAKQASLGILGETTLMDAPVSVQSYTEEAIETHQARTLADVLENDPSVRYTTNSGHVYEHFTVRGMDVTGQDLMVNGLYGIAPKAHVPTEFISRVEVLRGPNSLLGGIAPEGSVGGSINLVTKQAGAEPVTDLTTSWSSDSYGEAHLDVARRLGKEKRFGVRVNTALGGGETGVDDQRKERKLSAINLDYLGDDWRVILDAYAALEEIKNGSPAMYGLVARRGAIVGVGELVDVPDNGTNMFRGTWGRFEDRGAMLRGEYDLNSDWTAYASIGGAKAKGTGLQFGTRVIVTDMDGTSVGYVYNINRQTQTLTGEMGLRGHFVTGRIKHALTTSVTELNFKDGTNAARNEGWPQDIYDPVDPVFPATPDEPEWSVDNVLRSLALADAMTLLDGKLIVTLGARLQDVKQKLDDYHESRLSPSAGVVIKPWGQDTSLYANYMEGLSPGETVPTGWGYANEGESFEPLVTKQLEVGVRQQWGALLSTLSAYQIERPTLIDDASGLLRIEGGDRRLRGVELGLQGDVTQSVELLGGIIHQQSEQRDSGTDNFGVPEWAANLGAQWRTPWDGLQLGARVVYTGKQWADADNTLRMPSWYRFDLNASYRLKLGTTPVTLMANVDNVTDREYWAGTFSSGYLIPSSPRTFRLAAKFSF